MKFSRRLAKVELIALAALAVAVVALTAYAAIWTSLHPSPFFTVADSITFVLVYGFATGCIPVVVFVAPLYAALLHNGRPSWPAAFFIGAIPGTVLLFVSVRFGLLALASGAFVAMATHAICASGSNRSSFQRER